MNHKCKRTNCQFYSQRMDNNCVALSEIYQDAYKCAFHKKREDQEEKEKERWEG